MNGTAIGVAAALLVGGSALYGGYQLFDSREAPDDAPRAEADVPRLPDPRSEELGDLDARAMADGRGAPRGEVASFSDGAPGEDATDAVRARAAEAEREAERLAMLGQDDLDVGGDAFGDDTLRGGDADDGTRRRGLRDAAADGVGGMEDGTGTARGDAPTDTDVERLLADIAARSGEPAAAVDSPSVRRASGTDATRFSANRRLTDKPDQGGFAANARLTDKPDQGGYVASADTQRFDPCEKADGTVYVGPGTALNPFAETDPCLPQATAQGYQVAQAAEPAPAPPAVEVAPVAALVPVNVARPLVPAPPATGVGSDYRG